MAQGERDGDVGTPPRLSLEDAIRGSLVSLPLIALNCIMVWFAVHAVAPTPSVEGSSANPLGLITSNFVYDGLGNIENLVSSSVFFLLVCLYLPSALRAFTACLLPVVAIGVGAASQITSISAVCSGPCSFYGMSAVSNAVIGYTLAGFAAAFVFAVSQNGAGPRTGTTAPKNLVVLATALVAYVVLLLFFAGLIGIPATRPSAGQGGTGSTPSILIQTPPVWVVHTASLAYGFVLCAVIFLMVNRRHRQVLAGTQPSQRRGTESLYSPPCSKW